MLTDRQFIPGLLLQFCVIKQPEFVTYWHIFHMLGANRSQLHAQLINKGIEIKDRYVLPDKIKLVL